MEAALDVIQQYPIVSVVVGVLLLLLLVWLVVRAIRDRRPERTVERPTGTVRRPIYSDVDLLDDLRAHGHGRGRADGDDEQAGPGRPATADTRPVGRDGDRSEQTRRIEATLTALEGTGVLIDLDADPDAELTPGKAVLLTGTLARHAASDAAEILELSAPLLQRSAANEGSTPAAPAGGVGNGTSADTAPVVVTLDHPSDRRSYLMVLPREHLLTGDPTTAGRVSVLAVVDRELGRRDTLAVEDYLGPHLSRDGRTVFGERDLADTIATLADVVREDLGADDLPFRGPGALLTPAAIQR